MSQIFMNKIELKKFENIFEMDQRTIKGMVLEGL